MYRGNAQHTGVFATQGIRYLQGLAWQIRTETPITLAPVFGDDSIYIVCENGELSALALSDGEHRWHTSLGNANLLFEESIIPTSVAVQNGVIYCLGGSSPLALYALDSATGEELWHFDLKIEQLESCSLNHTPVIAENIIYFTCDALYALDLNTHQLLWRAESTYKESGISAPVISDDVIAITSAEYHHGGALQLFQRHTGQLKWETEVEYAWDVAISHQQLFIIDGGVLKSFNLETGKLEWSLTAGTDVSFDQLAVTDKLIVCDQSDGGIRAIDRLSRETLWIQHIDAMHHAPIVGGPIITDNIIYVSGDKILFALDIATGKPYWRFPATSPLVADPALQNGLLVCSGEDGIISALH